MSGLIQYSVVIPVFGAEKSLEQLHHAICGFFANRYSFEVIYVNDGSRDHSWEVLRRMKQSSENMIAVNLCKNYGQHAATICGIKHSRGQFVITMDDDLEVHPDEIAKLIASQTNTGSDIVYGVYPKLNQSFLRAMLTSVYKLLAKTEGREKGKGSSFRLMKRDLAKKLSDNHKQFVFIDELCLWYTDKITFLPCEPNKAFINKQRYGLSSLFSLTSTVVLFSSTFPLKLVTRIGIALSATNLIIGCHYLFKKLFYKIPVSGYTSLIVSILFSTGLIIFCIGIIAQYLSQILRSVNNAPSYSESEVI
ncbi:MAG: glycosyltransferase [Bacteroidetes bacterium]|nr:glycosyltransferase [Bacteroidota bacterium]